MNKAIYLLKMTAVTMLFLAACLVSAYDVGDYVQDGLVEYCDESGIVQYCTDYTPLTDSTTSWGDGNWYVLTNNVTISSRVEVSGAAHLILADRCTLTIPKGIHLTETNALSIFGQSVDTNVCGRLVAEMTKYSDECAGIGGNYGESGGVVVIAGGTVSTIGGSASAGIGGGNCGDGGDVKIFCGTVTARGNAGGAGIGSGGKHGSGGKVAVVGGTVTATGGSYGPGIGGGHEKDGGTGGGVTITGGAVTATGGRDSAGIGGGGGGTGGVVTISGGAVTVTGGDYGAGIGGGFGGAGGTVTITGGVVVATGGINSPGIGGGCEGDGGEVLISGGTVTAAGNHKSAGIGVGAVKITGGSVKADFKSQPTDSEGTNVYCVTVEGFPVSNAVAVAGLPASYGTNDIFAIDGKVYIWLPNGNYAFTADGFVCSVTVAGSPVTVTGGWPSWFVITDFSVLDRTAILTLGSDLADDVFAAWLADAALTVEFSAELGGATENLTLKVSGTTLKVKLPEGAAKGFLKVKTR